MSAGLALPDAVDQFRDVIAARLGLYCADSQRDMLAALLDRRLAKRGEPAERYLHGLQTQPPVGELSALAQALTITETYFFRNIEQFQALAQVVFSARMKGQSHGALRFLSAGCASGEEAYTISMVARDAINDPAWTVSVDGFDLNPDALERARWGYYSAWSLRETPPDIQRKWFHTRGRDMVLCPSAREGVRFLERNLADDGPPDWPDGMYDAIFCRNVMMYFTPIQAAALIARLRRALKPNGYLFLGHAETLRGLSDDFDLCHTHGTFYYQRREEQAVMVTPVRYAMPKPVVEPEIPPALMAWSRITDLLRRERFSEALSDIHALPVGLGRNPDFVLLEAMLLAHGDRITEARAVCARLLAADEMNAGAHYVLALCAENLDEIADAVDHNRAALSLDPGFAMPRLHLGLLAYRVGDRITARQELAQARLLLARENAARILLFGGGFDRGALIALCDAALRDCGGGDA